MSSTIRLLHAGCASLLTVLLFCACAHADDDSDAYEQGEMFRKQHRLTEAIQSFNTAIKQTPKRFKIYCKRAVCYSMLGKYDLALADFATAIKLKPDDSKPYRERGRTYRVMKQYQKALADYTKAATLEPDDGGSWFERGLTYNDIGQYKNALKDLSAAIALEHEYKAYCARADAYMGLKQYNSALADLNQAIKLDPLTQDAYFRRAAVYEKLGQHDLAEKDIQEGKHHIPWRG